MWSGYYLAKTMVKLSMSKELFKITTSGKTALNDMYNENLSYLNCVSMLPYVDINRISWSCTNLLGSQRNNFILNKIDNFC